MKLDILTTTTNEKLEYMDIYRVELAVNNKTTNPVNIIIFTILNPIFIHE